MKRMTKRTWGRWLAGLLSVVMVLALLSAAALAEDETLPAQDEQTVDGTETPSGGGEAAPAPDGTPEPDPESTETPDTGAASDPESSDAPAPAQQVQALIDALPDPEAITNDNRADVQAQLDAIAAAMLELTEDEAAALDTARYDAAVAALSALGDQTADPDPDPDPVPNSDPEPSAGPSALEQVQALIDALPDAESITADNRADVEEQLNAIDEAKLALGDEERDALDVTRYMAAVAALSALDGQAGADEPEAMAFPDGFSGNGTSGDPYLIENAEQLKALSTYVNSGNNCQDTYFKLTKNIDLEGSEDDPWTPIDSFRGTLDGGGYTVSGLFVDGTGYAGLFGLFSGTVKNLGVSGSVTSSGNAGGIAGQNSGTGTIENCSFTGTVKSSGSMAGGITGLNSGTIRNCYNSGSVEGGGQSTGGIAGQCTGTIENCYNTGNINGGQQAGGILGLGNSCTVKNCYNTGIVSRTSYVGGIVGYNLKNSTIQSCYYLDSTATTGVGGGDSSEATAKSAGAFHFLASTLGEGWADSVAGRPVLLSNRETDIISADVPYEIPDADTMKAFREFIDSDPDHGKNKVFKLTENIVLGGAGDPWTPVGGSDNPFQGTFDGGNKTISGLYINNTANHGYQGLFGHISDGGTVKNLTVEGEINDSASISNVGGIVGAINGGTIDNCHNAATVTSSSGAGGIVGASQNSAIKNCRNTGKINGGDNTGGIVGMSRSGGPIENCHNTADITGSGANAGGVVGIAYDITVSGCSNTGAVSGTDNIGGVAGQINSFSSDGVIQNCCNTGAVTGTGSSNIGGVVGMNSSSNCTTENCYNTGAVNGKGGVGGVAGLNSGTVKNCYNTGAVKVTTESGQGGGVVGYGACTDCYYLEPCGATGQGTPKSAGQFASGEVAWLLQKDQSSPVWGQTVNSGTPELTASPEKKVYQITGVVEEQDDVVWYSNSKASLPAAQPAKEGFTFAGWSTEEARTKADLVKDFPVSSDMTVYAVFTQMRPGTGAVTMADYTCGDGSVEPVAESATNGTGNVKFTYSERGRDAFSETKPTKAGEYTVKAVFAATDDYNEVTATADFKITHQFNAGWEQRDNGRYRLCACGTGLLLETKTLTEVPEGLKQVPAVDTVEEIERVLAEQVAAGDHYVVYDVELETLVGGAWVIVTPESLPDEGVAVTVPYPEGTNAKDLFTVVHMFTTAGGGHAPGETETLKAANEADGIHFTLKSFSPVLIGWKTAEPSAAPTDNRPGNAPNTGDETPLALWSSLMVISLIGVTAIALPPLMGKKKPLSTNGRHMRK